VHHFREKGVPGEGGFLFLCCRILAESGISSDRAVGAPTGNGADSGGAAASHLELPKIFRLKVPMKKRLSGRITGQRRNKEHGFSVSEKVP
jgi:hypothetical protein